MKNLKYLISFFFIGLTMITNAQKLEIGAEFGNNIIPLTINGNELGQTYGLGIHSGLKAQYHINDYLSITTGIAISQKQQYHEYSSKSDVLETLENVFSLLSGGGIDLDSIVDALGVNTDINRKTSAIITMNNLEIPVLATLRYKKLRVYAGGYGGILLSAKRKQKTETTIPFLQAFDIASLDETGIVGLLLPSAQEVSTEVNNNTNDLNAIDYGLIAGIGYQTQHWSFNAFYSHGIAHYRLLPSLWVENHYALRFTMGYQISFSKENDKIIIQ